MDPRNPSVLDVRGVHSEYIVYYSHLRPVQGIWHLERVSDGAILHQGSLEAMLALLPQYPNSRRATWAEDTLRLRTEIFYQEYRFPIEDMDGDAGKR